MNVTEIIDRLPAELAARLRCDSFFQDITVVAADEGNVEATIAKLQAVLAEKNKKRGLAVIVCQIIADDEESNITGGPLTLRPSFQIFEQREINLGPNGTKKSARKTARRIRDVFKNSGLVGITTAMKPAKPFLEPVTVKDMAANIILYQVNFTCLEQGGNPITVVATPLFVKITDLETPQLQITCATPGASVYYTLDDSYPEPPEANPLTTAQLYAAPIVIRQGGIFVRACAFLGGENNIASWVARCEIPADFLDP